MIALLSASINERSRIRIRVEWWPTLPFLFLRLGLGHIAFDGICLKRFATVAVAAHSASKNRSNRGVRGVCCHLTKQREFRRDREKRAIEWRNMRVTVSHN